MSARPFGPDLLIGELIGRGGMSRVYRGWLRASGEQVAVKVLRDDLASRPDAVQRFVRERDLLHAVASPHVVRVHDLVVHGDELAIVMDLVPGGHLRRAVALPCMLQEAAELAAQIAEGLAAVHSAGVVHRDLKPENVLVEVLADSSRLLRLTDFGISRLVDSSALTQTQVTGTPGYLAPEVAAGGRVTSAADVYALGVLGYELCTGRQPFVAENPLLLVLAHTRQEPPRPTGMPDALWDLLARTLAKDPTLRPSAAQVGHALRSLAPGLAGLPPCTVPAVAPAPATPVPAPPRPERPAADVRSPQAPQSQARQHQAPPTVAGAVAATGSHVILRPGAPEGPRTRAQARQEFSSTRQGRRSPDSRRGGGSPRSLLGSLPRSAVVAAGVVGALVLVAAVAIGVRLSAGSGTRTVEVASGPATAPPPSRPPAARTATTSSDGARSRPTGQAPPTQRALVADTSPAATPTAASSPGPSTAPTTAPSTPTSSTTTTTTSTSGPLLPPGTPTLQRVARTPEDQHASDGIAKLSIGGVVPRSGTVTSITVRYTGAGQGDGRRNVTPTRDAKVTDYETTVDGLVNGAKYTFSVEVCNSGGRCATSQQMTFTPYGAPEVQAPTLSLTAPAVKVTAHRVLRHANPGTPVCTIAVTSTPTDPMGPADRQVSPDGETFTFPAKAATTYVATETCRTADVLDGTVPSTPLAVGAI